MSVVNKVRLISLLAVFFASQSRAQTSHPVGITPSDSTHQRFGAVQTLKSVLGSPYMQTTFTAVGDGFVGGFAGWVVDQIYCNQHYGDEPSFILPYCASYSGYGAAIGWGGGSLIGATWTAAHLAKKKGCPLPVAMGRAFVGAALGVTPAALIVVNSAPALSRHETLFVAGAPIFAALLATALSQGCRA